jgi:fructose-1,6-bisphosphatase I
LLEVQLRRARPPRHAGVADLLRPGTEQVAAGYIVYGPSTMLVYADDTSVDGFTLDRSVGEFFLTHPDVKIPSGGKSYAVNEANFDRWSPRSSAWSRCCATARRPASARPRAMSARSSPTSTGLF